MIIKIIYSYFTLANLTSLAEKIRSYLIQKFPEHPMLGIILAQLQESMEKARQAVGSTTKQEHTKALRQADKRRDDSFRSLRDHIQAGISRQNEAYSLACQVLYPIFEKNGLKMYKLADGDETTAINSLADDLSGPEEQAHLATVNAVEWLQELMADNQNFLLASQQRSAKRTADTTVPDKQAADQLRKSLELLCSTLETLQAVAEPDGIDEAVNEANQYIKEANASARLSQ